MTEYRTILERDLERVSCPAGFTFDDLGRRRDRKRRNQRIAAGVVGMAAFVAAVWVLGIQVGRDTTTPADRPTGTRGGKTAEDVARDFLYETAFFETDLAVLKLANDDAVSGLGLDGIEEFRRWLSFNEATGFTIIPTSCEETGSSGRDTSVRCTFDFHGIRSEDIGRGPYSGSYLDLLVRLTPQQWGSVRDASIYLETAEFGPQMWVPFAEWVSTTYPEDVSVMYSNDDFTDYRLTPRSIQLWEQRTSEYAETGPAETGPTETGPTETGPTVNPGKPYYGLPSEGAEPSSPEHGELVEFVRELHRGSAYVYADGRVISWSEGSPPYGYREQRLTPEGVQLIRSGDLNLAAILRAGPDSYPGPAGAWEDSTPRPFVPYRYAICMEGWGWGTLGDLPAAAADLLRDRLQLFETGMSGGGWDCYSVTTEEARALHAILIDEGFMDRTEIFQRAALLDVSPERSADNVPIAALTFYPVLPHGAITHQLG